MPTLKKILVVEDETPYLHALVLKLRKSGYEVEGANNGADAMKFLKENKFDLLLLDLVMPDVNGFVILEDLKKRWIKLSTIVLSNLSQEEDKQKISSYKVVDFIEKMDTTIVSIVAKVNKELS